MSAKTTYKVFFTCALEKEEDPYAIQTVMAAGKPSKKTGIVTVKGIKCDACRVTLKVTLDGDMTINSQKPIDNVPEHLIRGVQVVDESVT